MPDTERRTVVYERPVCRYRFLLHDGGFLDVLTDQPNDSVLAEFAYLTYYGKDSRKAAVGNPARVLGVANMGPKPIGQP